MKLSLTARLTAAAVAVVTGVSLGVQAGVTAATMPEATAAEVAWALAQYFTILTNTLVLLVFAFMAVSGRGLGAGPLAAVTLWAALVGLVYHLLLADAWAPQGAAWWADQGLHTVMPLAVFTWWSAFAPMRGLRGTGPVVWLVWPLIYTAYAMTRGVVEGGYPYFFLDLEQFGAVDVMRNIAALAVALLIGGYLLLGLGYLLRRTP